MASEKRNPLLPDVPTLAEQGVKGAEVQSWQAIAAPKGGLAGVARARMREFRNSLVPAGERLFVARPITATYDPFSQLSPACYDRRDRLRRVCGGTAK